MCQREVLVIGDGTTISTWSYEQRRRSRGGAQQNRPFFNYIFSSKKSSLGMKPTTSRTIKQHSNSRATSVFG